MTLPRFRVTERQALMWIMGASLLAYVGTFALAISRRPSKPRDSSKRPHVYWMRPQPKVATDSHYLVADLFDPSLLSLPSVHGFSRALWQHTPSAVPPASGWRPTLAFLPTPAPAKLKSLLNQPSLGETVQTVAHKSRAVTAEQPEATASEPVEVRDRSALLVTGVLTACPLVAVPDLPTIPSASALRPTLVRIAVAPDGTVRHALLEHSCGNDAADAQALALVPQTRFEPFAARDTQPRNLAGDLVWGIVKIAWTISPP